MAVTSGRFTWTTEHIATLRRMHGAGGSATQIAVAIGHHSRSAVLGKVHRLGLSRPIEPSAPKTKPQRLDGARSVRIVPNNIVAKAESRKIEASQSLKEHVSKAEERLESRVLEASGENHGVLFLERGLFQCAMPQPGWDDLPVAEKRVCGRPVKGETSWCPACLKIVSAPPAYRALKDSQIGIGARR